MAGGRVALTLVGLEVESATGRTLLMRWKRRSFLKPEIWKRRYLRTEVEEGEEVCERGELTLRLRS